MSFRLGGVICERLDLEQPTHQIKRRDKCDNAVRAGNEQELRVADTGRGTDNDHGGDVVQEGTEYHGQPEKTYQQLERIAFGYLKDFYTDLGEQAAAADEFHEDGGPNNDADRAPVDHLDISGQRMPVVRFSSRDNVLPSGQNEGHASTE